MMLETILAIGFIGLILLVISFKLDDKHQVLKVLSLFFAVFVILMLGRSTIDSKEVCGREINKIVNNTYSYNTVCFNTTNSQTPSTVYISTLWYFRVVFIYVFGFLIWLVGTYLLKLNSMRKT